MYSQTVDKQIDTYRVVSVQTKFSTISTTLSPLYWYKLSLAGQPLLKRLARDTSVNLK